ncbi:MAG: hypothetical protein OXC53_01175 [Rhodobacteraceae bacterium]|nr:hypothetical protein [Paracoccaceae bacterium]
MLTPIPKWKSSRIPHRIPDVNGSTNAPALYVLTRLSNSWHQKLQKGLILKQAALLILTGTIRGHADMARDMLIMIVPAARNLKMA